GERYSGRHSRSCTSLASAWTLSRFQARHERVVPARALGADIGESGVLENSLELRQRELLALRAEAHQHRECDRLDRTVAGIIVQRLLPADSAARLERREARARELAAGFRAPVVKDVREEVAVVTRRPRLAEHVDHGRINPVAQ